MAVTMVTVMLGPHDRVVTMVTVMLGPLARPALAIYIVVI